MNISKGVYRGFKVVVHLVPETSGQIAVSVATKDKDNGEILKSKIGQKDIRKTFNLPEEDTREIRFFMLDEEQNGGEYGFQWLFMFDRLSGSMSKYEFLACIFRAIDELIKRIVEFKKENEVNQPK